MVPETVVSLIGSSAAVITTLCWLPQAFKIIRDRDASSISYSSYGALAIGVAMWLAYGLLIGSVPVIAANAVTLVFVIAILGLKAYFTKAARAAQLAVAPAANG
ncbi:MtN3/saliva family protein [Hartmannibacter diazotrophicus]|uniref:MtN3/saliva family protein n=1 Tax=Hartmannibacter diazotrophicus TaxID=1482074 RepID=A0A2C9D9Z7_9HYPH|nr:SemiSWEET transporter [Hartmannibacter diazotrophicus]SON57009.1 MtN3/saliva family protein [Hartmannibacter diazotrophicus]